MSRVAVTTLAGLALAAAGCMGPRPHAPEAASMTPPARWITDPGPARDPLPDWWTALQDPVLDALVARAIANNTDVLTAAERIEEAEAQVRLARSAQRPTADLSFLGVPRRRTYSTATGDGVTAAGYAATLGVSYDTDLFGRLRAQTGAARAQLLGTRAAADAVRIATIASVVGDYVSLRASDAALAIAQDTLRSRRKQLDIVSHQARSGYVVQVSVNQASAELHSVEQQIAGLTLQIRRQEDALSILLGDNPGTIPRGRMLIDLPLFDAPATVPARLLRRRPDIYEAEQAMVAADRGLDAARAAFMPDLQLALQGERVDANLLPSPLWIYSFAGTVLAPLFEGGKLRANQDAAAARRNQAALAYRRAALDAFGQVEDALAAVDQLATKERAAIGARDDLGTALHAARRRFDRGYSSYQEVLDTERGLLSAQLALNQTRADRIIALVSLYQAMGGGWDTGDVSTGKRGA
jgi:outer membrane protein, multidrug efflux system